MLGSVPFGLDLAEIRAKSCTGCLSMPRNVPGEQIGSIVGAIVAPEAWMDRMLIKILRAHEAERVRRERSGIGLRIVHTLRKQIDAYASP